MFIALRLAENILPTLLKDRDRWHTLDINYAKPHVERIWCQWEEYRINLHRIHPCRSDEVFFHPHRVPSAMSIFDGEYEMLVGYGPGLEEPPVAARIILASGSSYEMTSKDAWHAVRPTKKPVYSLMVTGKPWDRPMPQANHPKLSSLKDETTEELFGIFGSYYGL